MNVSQQFFSKDFADDVPKEAYLKACAWVAKVVLSKSSKVEVSNLTWKISPVSKTDLPTYRLELFVTYDEEDVNSSMCEVCKQLHSSFFSNNEFNCSKCNKEAYRKREQQKLDVGCGWYNETISKMLNEYN